MEDASAIDLDWFWRGWFYTTDYVDIAIDNVKWYKIGTTETSADSDILKDDNFNSPSNFNLIASTENLYGEFKGRMNNDEFINKMKSKEFYEITFSNLGGLVMPVLLDFKFEDGTTEHIVLPVEVWRKNENKFSKLFYFDKKVVTIKVDKNNETADVDESNNSFPREEVKSQFEEFKEKIKG